MKKDSNETVERIQPVGRRDLIELRPFVLCGPTLSWARPETARRVEPARRDLLDGQRSVSGAKNKGKVGAPKSISWLGGGRKLRLGPEEYATKGAQRALQACLINVRRRRR